MKKLVPAGSPEKSNFYHSREYGGYKKVNKKHSLLGFEYKRKTMNHRRHPEFMAWGYNTRNNFNSWIVTTAPQYRNQCSPMQLELCFASTKA